MPVLLTFTFFSAILLCSIMPAGKPLWSHGYSPLERLGSVAFVAGMWFILSTILLVTVALIVNQM